jgi:hypothetical protein
VPEQPGWMLLIKDEVRAARLAEIDLVQKPLIRLKTQPEVNFRAFLKSIRNLQTQPGG